MNYQAIIKEILGDYLVPQQSYYVNLPDVLQKWYCYTKDSGHSILCVLKQYYRPQWKIENFKDNLIPCSVKTVLKNSFEEINNFIVLSGVHYDENIGLIEIEDNYEF